MSSKTYQILKNGIKNRTLTSQCINRACRELLLRPSLDMGGFDFFYFNYKTTEFINVKPEKMRDERMIISYNRELIRRAIDSIGEEVILELS